MRAAGLVLAGGRSSRMGVPKAALEWHGSTLLRRTVGVLPAASTGRWSWSGRPARSCRALPADVEVRRRPARGPRAAAGDRHRPGGAGRPGRRTRSSARPTCRSCTPRSYARVVAGAGRQARRRGAAGRRAATASRWPPPTAPRWPPRGRAARRPTGCARRSCSRRRRAASRRAALLADRRCAAADPELGSVVNVNKPADYGAAGRGRRRRSPSSASACWRRRRRRGRAAVRAATVGRGRAGRRAGPRPPRAGRRQRRPDRPRRRAAAGRRRRRRLPVGGRRWLTRAPGGYFGRALVVDVDRRDEPRSLPLPEQVLRDHLGGVGLGTWLLTELGPAGVDPLAPEAPLAFVFSPLVGTPLTTSAKFAVVAKSPLTGLLTDALASSHFAIAGKLTGHDAIVLVGRGRPAVRRCSSTADGVAARAGATTLWGLTAAEAEAGAAGAARPRLAGRLDRPGRRARGPLRHHLPRRPARRPRRARRGAGRQERQGGRRPRRDQGRARRPGRRCWPRPRTCARARSARRPRSTASWGRSPTCWRSTRYRPCRPATSTAATSTGAAQLAAEELRRRAQVATHLLRGLHDRLRAHLPPPRAAGRSGWSTRSSSPSARCAASPTPTSSSRPAPAATSSGIDTISAGGTIAFAMECAERGLLDAPWLRFGDGDGAAAGARRDRQPATASARCWRWVAGGRAGRRKAPALRPPRQGAGAARLRAADACRRWRSGWPSAPAAPTTTAPAPTRPTSPAPRPARRRTGPRRAPRSRPRTAPRSWTR